MPSRYYQRIFIPGYFYHVYNRGTNKEKIFLEDHDYKTFTDILAYYLTFPSGMPLSILRQSVKKVPNLNEVSSIKLCAFCLMPNHFHFLIKLRDDTNTKNNISNLMRRCMITYSMYAKQKYDRSGTLFEGKYKNILVDSDEQLLQLSKYIHRNPLELLGSKPLSEYLYSSYPYFVHPNYGAHWLDTSEIISYFSKKNKSISYQKFVEEIPLDIERIKNSLLE